MCAMKNEILDGFYLGEYLVKPLTGQVARHGESVHLPPRAVEVLLYLCKNPRTLVAREDLLAHVWGDDAGTSEALSHAIGEIRHAFDDHANHPHVIQTVPRRGYRLLLEPEIDSPSEDLVSTMQPPKLWRALVRHGVVQAGVAYLVVGWLLIQVADATFDNLGFPSWAAPLLTFAVVGGFPIVILLSWFLEFANGRLSRDTGRQRGDMLGGLGRNYLAIVAAYLVSGIGTIAYQAVVGFDAVTAVDPSSYADALEADAILPVQANSVAVLKLFNIDGTEDTQTFANGLSEDILDRVARIPGLRVPSRGDSWSLDPNVKSQEVRQRLRVAYYLEGSVRLTADKIRVVAQLIDSATGSHIVSRSFDRDLSDFLELQREITALIVANLRTALPETLQLDPAYESPDADIDAYVRFRQGRDLIDGPKSESGIRAAIDKYQEALAIDPGYAAAHAGICDAYTALYQLNSAPSAIESADTACAGALANGPRLPLVHRAIGRFRLATGEVSAAETAFRQALAINDVDASAMIGLSRVLRRDRRLGEAEDLIREAIELQPGNWRAMNSLGGLYFGLGRFTDAVEQYQRVSFLNPGNHIVLGNLGSANLMLGNFETAREHLTASIEIEPQQQYVSNLGIVHYYLGRFRESAQHHRQAVAGTPDAPEAWLALGDALYFAGERSLASEAFEEAARLAQAQMAIDPSDPATLTTLGWAQAMLGNLDDASEILEEALSVAPDDPYSHYYLALLLARQDRPEDALMSIASAIDTGYSQAMLRAEPYLAELTDSPGFLQLMGEEQ